MDHLPRSDATAALNMARDLLMLEAYPEPARARFRCYGWAEPAFSFGVSQRWAEWRPRAPEACALVRRPTGGGLVSHLGDWTFALVLPPGHPVQDLDALESYGVVLAALERALLAQGLPVRRVPRPEGERRQSAPAVCAERPEPHDLVRADDGRKVAGAAQKRGRDGLLLQGYIERAALPGCDWPRLEADAAAALAEALGTAPRAVGEPSYPKETAAELAARFGSRAWNERL